MKTVSRALGAMLVLALSLSAAIAVAAAPDRQQPGVLLPDQPQRSELTDLNGVETWTFEGQANTLVVIDMRADPGSSLDPYLSLRDLAGNELAYDDDGGSNFDSHIGPFLLPETGTYSVVAGRVGGTGGYTIQLTVIEDLPVLVIDQPQQSELTDFKEEETWTFEGQANTLVVIDMRAAPGSSLDPHLSLRDLAGNELAFDDDGGSNLDSRIGPFLLPETGTYSVVAGRMSGTGGYTIQLSVIEDLAVIDFGQPVTGVLSAEHTADYYLLPTVETPTLVRLLAPFDSDHIPPLFEVFGPDGSISSSEYMDRPEIDPLLLLPDTTYTVIANWDGKTSSAPYELRLEESRIAMLTPGAPQTGKLSDANYFRQTHYFRGEAGQRLIISLTTEDPISPSFDISSLDGSTYLFNSNGTATRTISVEIEIPASLAYQIQVYDGSYGYNEGSYTISIEVAGTRTLSK